MSRKTKKTTKKRAQRATSNVFAMFDQASIQEFKEAFTMIDQNKDGFIDKEDLQEMLASLGKTIICWLKNYFCFPVELIFISVSLLWLQCFKFLLFFIKCCKTC